jgi:hypothetical protein
VKAVTDHPRRQAILAVLAAHPGCTFRGVARQAGIPSGCVRHHLNVLERQSRAWSTRIGGRLAIFAGTKPDHAQWVAVQHLPDSLDRRLLNLAANGPVRGQQTFFPACPDTPPSTVQHRLARLVRWVCSRCITRAGGSSTHSHPTSQARSS